MATVRFSQDLRDRILRTANSVMSRAVEKVEATRPDNDWAQRIYDTMFRTELPLVKQIDPKWFRTRGDIMVSRIGTTKVDMTLKLPQALIFPFDTTPTVLYSKDNNKYGDWLNLHSAPEWAELEAEVQGYLQRLLAAVKRKEEYAQAVKAVIDHHSTLAPALKAWPALWDLLPEETKTRHREVKDKTKGTAAGLAVDLDKLTAMTTAAKFGL
jgi:hypothetical protein